MIIFYSGTPGSGKSLHVARVITNRLRIAKKPVICSFKVNLEYLSDGGKKKLGNFLFCPLEPIEDTESDGLMCVDFLKDYAIKNHVRGKEGQTLVVIDEAQRIYNPRDLSKGDRLKWIDFYCQHRHLGFDFIIISQFDRLIDRQIRCLFEIEIKHRKANNYSFFRLSPIPVFVAISVWYGLNLKIDSEFFFFRKKFQNIYDSYDLWNRLGTPLPDNGGQGVPMPGEGSPQDVTALSN
ncbi:zonular occludens toxin domain-containing protein [Anaerotignum propionicum]|uniref:zonular occludens toxin domain-containing protein n=1 Tax=Anaerotignum propionicum TaxID=28446 RepID=UPI0028A249F0|nr:zonular occludens toxin domain-containing protein [Anaerotignum propionicum]